MTSRAATSSPWLLRSHNDTKAGPAPPATVRAAGSHVLALVRDLRMPVVITLHTLLREPKADQRRVMEELIARSTRLVVMAEQGRQMLQEVYQAPPAVC